jgi:3-deoxy-D-manno-octulosonic-acid transferase
MRWYSAFVLLIAPFLLLYKWRIMRRFGLQHRLKERLGFATPAPADIWVHAASVGEINTVLPYLDALHHRGHRILVSTVTSTGYVTLRQKSDDKFAHIFFALDLGFIWKRLLACARPKLLVLVEREIWPNLVKTCHQHHIPVLLINARMTKKSRQSRITRMFRPAYATLTQVWAQSESDRDELIRAGAPPKHTHNIGNLKYRITPPTNPELFHFGKRPVWVAGSTHAGEETLLLSIHRRLLHYYPDALCVIAPRHPQRFEEVWHLVHQSEPNACRHSNPSTLPYSVYVLDTLGSLLACYAHADICFVGGSLVEGIGGHNLLEPALYAKPVLSGTHLEEFQHMAQTMIEHEALIQFSTVEEGVARILELWNDPVRRQRIGENGRKILDQHADIVERYIALTEGVLRR